MPHLIGFTGPKGSGKNVAATYLVRNKHWKETAFAERLKLACQCLFDLSHDQLYGNAKEIVDPRWGCTPRHIMQFVGTEGVRDTFPKYVPALQGGGESLFIKHFQNFYRLNQDHSIVVNDVRFKDEAQAIWDLGGKVVYIDRDQQGAVDSHASEQFDFEPDFVIHNNSSFDKLHASINEMIKGLA